MKRKGEVFYWNPGWNGHGKKVDGVRVTLSVFLGNLEEEGWEIFSVNQHCRNWEATVVCRKPV